MEKAFDRVPHEKLLYKLEYLGFRNPLLHWMGVTSQIDGTEYLSTASPQIENMYLLAFHKAQ